jgi:hypothetical protein
MNHDQAAVDPARSNDRTITGCFGYPAVDPLAGGSYTRSELTEAAGVDQYFNSFPGRQFAPAVLPFNVLGAAAD